MKFHLRVAALLVTFSFVFLAGQVSLGLRIPHHGILKDQFSTVRFTSGPNLDWQELSATPFDFEDQPSLIMDELFHTYDEDHFLNESELVQKRDANRISGLNRRNDLGVEGGVSNGPGVNPSQQQEDEAVKSFIVGKFSILLNKTCPQRSGPNGKSIKVPLDGDRKQQKRREEDLMKLKKKYCLAIKLISESMKNQKEKFEKIKIVLDFALHKSIAAGAHYDKDSLVNSCCNHQCSPAVMVRFCTPEEWGYIEED